MDLDQENKVDEDRVEDLSDRIFLGFCRHHGFLSDPCLRKKFHDASSTYISFLSFQL
jgi:hypothetical protein